MGVAHDDGPEDVSYLANKTVHLRIFGDYRGHLNGSLLDVKGEILVVSQFTLLGDTRKGRRPSYTRAAGTKEAETLYRLIVDELKKWRLLLTRAETQKLFILTLKKGNSPI